MWRIRLRMPFYGLGNAGECQVRMPTLFYYMPISRCGSETSALNYSNNHLDPAKAIRWGSGTSRRRLHTPGLHTAFNSSIGIEAAHHSYT